MGRTAKYLTQEERQAARRAQSRLHVRAHRARKKAQTPSGERTSSEEQSSKVLVAREARGSSSNVSVKSESLSVSASPRRSQPRDFIDAYHTRTRGDPTADTPIVYDIVGTPEERSHFHYFYHDLSVPLARLGLDSAFWMYGLPKASMAEPAVRHATIAFTALHRDLEKHRSKQIISWSPFVLAQYNKAIAALRVLDSSHGASKIEVVLLTCMIFACLSLMVGEDDRAVNHLEHGITLINTHMADEISTPRGVSGDRDAVGDLISRRAILYTYRRIDIQATFWVRWHRPTLTTGVDKITMPSFFCDLEEAREAFNKLFWKLLDLRFPADRINTPDMSNLKIDTIAAMLQMQRHLDIWERAFAPLAAALQPPDPGQPIDTGVTLVKIFLATGRILATPRGIGTTSSSSLSGYFAQIVAGATALYNLDRKGKRQFAVDRVLVGFLHMTTKWCDDPIIRAEAEALLGESSGRGSAFSAALDQATYAGGRIVEEVGFNRVMEPLDMPEYAGE